MNNWKGTSGEALSPTVLVALAGTALAAWLWSAQAPADLQALRNAAQAHFEEKRTAAAIEVFEQVAESSDATAADWRNLALARYELGGSEETDAPILAALDRAEALQGDHPATRFLRGLVFSRRGRDAEAAVEFEAGASHDATDPATLYNWAASLHNQDRVDEALPIYERVAAMGFDVAQQFFVSSLYRTGRALAVADGVAAARPYIERYSEYQRRLSQAQRAPTALEAGRYKRVEVPRANLVPANPASAAEVRFVAESVGAARVARPIARDLGSGVRVVTEDAGAAGAAGVVQLPTGVLGIGDADRDGLPDAAVFGPDGLQLLRNVGDDRFELAAATGLPEVAGVRAADWVDADHDGDLDLMLVTDVPGAGFRWIANHGGWAFAEMTAEANLGGAPAMALGWADFDDDSDIDFYVVHADGSSALYSNARGGQFVEVGAAVGATGELAATSVLAEDFDNDGWFDLLRTGTEGTELLVNNGDGTFAEALAGPAGADEYFAGDLNNDGWLDLVAADGAAFVNDGSLGFAPLADLDVNGRVLALIDRQGDGALDLLVDVDGDLSWLDQAAPVANWVAVGLTGVKNNLEGIGTLVEVKAGGAYQRRLQRERVLHVGLGGATTADVVRITWPNGIIQNETETMANALVGPVGEVERLEGSCPLLYTWDGTQWRFINEVLGVAPLGMPLAADVIHPADFDEYVPIPGDALVARDGVFEVRLTEELREAGYLDTLRLLAVDHPIGTEVHPDERFVPPPHPEFGIYSVADSRPVSAVDQDGRDWTSELRELDGERARPFDPYLYEGLATSHHLELSLPASPAPGAPRLFLTGWVYWATGSINLQVDEDPRVRFAPVRLDVPDGRGGWRTAIDDIGLPNAKNSTLVVNLEGLLNRDDPRVRLVTTMRLYWDAATYTEDGGATLYRPTGDWSGQWGVPHAGDLSMASADAAASAGGLRVTVLAPESADIRWRGFSALHRDADGFETFDYANVSDETNWNQHRGSYTRYGSVDDLLDSADDRLVLIGTGDEVAVRFIDTLPPVAEGWERNWLLYLNGWVKDGDPNTVGGERVEPLPTHRMTTYPGSVASGSASTDADWREVYNTRPAREVNAPLRPRR